jgi:quercetin dioxygenase-like cupin family protein
MQKMSLDAIAREQLAAARRSSAARSATTVFGGHERAMRQTVIALLAGHALAEHENPGEATVYVIAGRIEISAGTEVWEGRAGDLLVVPDAPHALRALEDAVVMLTAVPRAHIAHPASHAED